MLKLVPLTLMIVTASALTIPLETRTISPTTKQHGHIHSGSATNELLNNYPRCPGLLPCDCKNRTIDCASRRLNLTPSFVLNSQTFDVLNLNSNHITSLMDDAFHGLTITEINLSFNKISNISNGAFNGVEKLIKILDLQFNHLATLPKVISYLENLEELHVSHNRILSVDTIDTNLLSMRKFVAGGNLLKQWPSWINRFPFLEELDLAYNPISTFPKDIQNLQWSLRKIILDNCQFSEVPQELSQLRRLEILDMSYNGIGDNGFHDKSFHGQVDSLQKLFLKDVNITKVPAALTSLKTLNLLDLSANLIESIHEDLLPTNITGLKLTGCKLHRIPSALSDLKLLENLALANNNILVIENGDLRGFTNLITLDVSSNNLKHISSHACDDLHNLKCLMLFDNKLQEIPNIIQRFSSLTEVNLEANPIHCTCRYVWPFQWILRNSSVKVGGYCDNLQGKDVSSFLANFSHYCHV